MTLVGDDHRGKKVVHIGDFYQQRVKHNTSINSDHSDYSG
jgi:hypothetical protein